MNSINSLKKDIKNEINGSPYRDVVDNVLNLLKYQIRKYFIEDNEKIDKLTSIIESLIGEIIGKTLENLGHSSHIIKYCINNFFEVGQEFTTDEFYDVIKNRLHHSNKTIYSKYINNESRPAGMLERVIDKMKTYRIKKKG